MVRRIQAAPVQTVAVQTVCLGVLFAVGMVGGYIYAGYCSGQSQLALSDYLSDYCALYQSGTVQAVSLWTAIRLYFSYVVVAFLLGFLSIGVLALPLLSGTYGFLTMFAVACFVQVYGRSGISLALAAFGPRVLFTVPCFLWVAGYAWTSASALATGTRGKRCSPVVYDSAYFYRLFLCVVLLMAGICVERYVVPYLFQMALGGL